MHAEEAQDGVKSMEDIFVVELKYPFPKISIINKPLLLFNTLAEDSLNFLGSH